MELQVQFWHSSDLTLWRTGYVIYTKIDGWHSNAHCSWSGLQRKINKIIDPSTHQNHLLLDISIWGTLYDKFSCHLWIRDNQEHFSQTNSGRFAFKCHIFKKFLFFHQKIFGCEQLRLKQSIVNEIWPRKLFKIDIVSMLSSINSLPLIWAVKSRGSEMTNFAALWFNRSCKIIIILN